MRLVIEGSAFERKLSPGERGTDETLAVMAEVVRDAAASPLVLAVVERIIDAAQVERGNGGKLRPHAGSILDGVYHYLRSNFKFRRDPAGVEELGLPDAMFEAIELGKQVLERDCDNVAVLGASLLAAMDFVPVFVVAATTDRGPWEHVFYGWWMGGDQVIPFDPQEGTPPGKWPEAVKRFKIFVVNRLDVAE